MKIFIVLALTFLWFNTTFCQTVNYSDLNNTQKKLKGKIDKYISKNGNTYSVGDPLTIGKPSGTNGKFVYITAQNSLAGIVEMGGDFVNLNIEIKNIWVVGKKGNQRVKISAKGGNKLNLFLFYFEEAVKSGEIKGKGMTSNEAMEELLNAKKKLELELITKDEYEKIKSELSKYIK